MSLNHPDVNLTAAPCVMVIFGATGDLTKRKLLPALCNLAQDDVLPKQFAIVGFAGNDFDTGSFRKMLADEIPKYAPAPINSKLWDCMNHPTHSVKAHSPHSAPYPRPNPHITT